MRNEWNKKRKSQKNVIAFSEGVDGFPADFFFSFFPRSLDTRCWPSPPKTTTCPIRSAVLKCTTGYRPVRCCTAEFLSNLGVFWVPLGLRLGSPLWCCCDRSEKGDLLAPSFKKAKAKGKPYWVGRGFVFLPYTKENVLTAASLLLLLISTHHSFIFFPSQTGKKRKNKTFGRDLVDGSTGRLAPATRH